MINAKPRLLLLCFFGAVVLAAIAAALVFGGVLTVSRRPSYTMADFGPPDIIYDMADYGDLAGWRRDDPTAALSAFLRSCDVFDKAADDAPANPSENNNLRNRGVSLSGFVSDWRVPCAEARAVDRQPHANPAARRSAIRAFFEYHFQPVRIISRRDPLPDGPARRAGPAIEETGTFTGYFEPVYRASRLRRGPFQAPLYPRPDDLIDVDLGDFRDDLRGERIAGRVDGERLIPYYDRRAIDGGVIAGSVPPIAWMDPNDLFFLQIQGSGRLVFSRNAAVRVGYAAANGRPYTPIGRVLIDQGEMTLEDVTMQSIREWLDDAESDAARALREQNESYVFFQELNLADPSLGPLGAQGVSLTPERSIAVDRRFHALGAPIWVDIDPVAPAGTDRIQKLMIAQDTGGAIRGPIRGDVFWGPGNRAGDIAGVMNAEGSLYVLVPRTVAERIPKRVLQ